MKGLKKMSQLYDVIYADPPWKYSNNQTTTARGAKPYSEMDLDDICELPVARLAADPCALFMWATYPKLPEALQVMGMWGFHYTTPSHPGR